MPRTRKSPADVFSYAELALAGNVTRRDVQYLSEAPDNIIPAGRGTTALKRVAVIGAFAEVGGLPLISAGRLAKTIIESEFNQEDGEAPSGLNILASKLSRKSMKSLPQAKDTNEYHYHLALWMEGGFYEPGIALKSDAMVEIIDRQFVMMSNLHTSKDALIGWLKNWERGSEIEMTPVTDEIGRVDYSSNPKWRTRFAKLESEAQHHRANAIGKVSINISLAIRSAFDRVAEHRLGIAG